jgi:sulfatase maturation enzyme AslB (radical SAM superfamily)
VDRLLLGAGARLRHLPGEVCLRCRDVAAPQVEPSPSLDEAIARCLQGTPGGAMILKARPGPLGKGGRRCADCGAHAEAARIDVGLGERAGLVIEDVEGTWCWGCGTAVIPNDGQEVRRRLAGLAWPALGVAVPSLLYDAPEHPASVQMEVTTRCNLECAYCTHRRLPDKRDMSLERFHELLDRIDLARVDNVDFTGLGEPVLHPSLPAMLRELLRRGRPTHLRTVTNGTALTRKRFEPLCDAGITSIAFSIDSLDPARFARARGGARLRQVLENLEALVEHRARAGLDGLQIKIKAVLLDEPYHDAEALLLYSARLGLEMPHFSCLDARADAMTHYREPWLESAWAEGGGQTFGLWAEARWRELAREPARPRAPGRRSLAQRATGFVHPVLAPPSELCRWAVDAAFITIDGDCLSCCEQMIDLPRARRGSLDGALLGELWQDDLLWSYRLPLSLGVAPGGCVGCAWAPPMPQGLTRPAASPRIDRTSPPT